MEWHSVRGARADQPTERRLIGARRSESAAFSHGMPRCVPPLPSLHCESPLSRFKTPMHHNAPAGTPPAPRTPPTTRLNRARTLPHLPFVHSRRAMAPSARREKQGGSSRKHGGSLEKAGNFFEIHGGLTSLSPLKSHHDAHKTNKTTSSHHKFPISVLIRGGYKKLVSFLFGQQGRDVYFCGVLQQYYTKPLHTMTI